MNSVSCSGTQSTGTPGEVHGSTPTLPCVRTGKRAAAIAAGFVDVWSTIRLLITRGCESYTKPFFCLYDEDAWAGKPAGAASASRKTGFVSRGNGWSAAANVSRPGKRLLHDPSTVRRPWGAFGSD